MDPPRVNWDGKSEVGLAIEPGSPAVYSEPTIFIVDDDPAACRAFQALVESMDLQAEAYVSGQDFLDAYDPAQPGCLLLDVRMPGLSGLDLLKRLAEERIPPPVIAVSAHGDVPMAVRAMKAGALDFLEKPCREQELWEAIQEALKRDAENRRRVAGLARIQRRLARLTQGERDVLLRLVDGKSNKAIAGELGLSVRTIEVRRAKVMQKMKAQSLAELVRLTLSVGQPCGKPHTAFGKPY